MWKVVQQILQCDGDIAGYHCEEHNNPADFFFDVISGNTPSQRQQHITIGLFATVFFSDSLAL